MQSVDERRGDESGTVERMLEEMSYQTDLLGRVLAEMKRANCRLEQVARQSCEAQNELHRQVALQRCMLKLLAYQVEATRAGNPGLAQLLDCKYGFDHSMTTSSAISPPARLGLDRRDESRLRFCCRLEEYEDLRRTRPRRLMGARVGT